MLLREHCFGKGFEFTQSFHKANDIKLILKLSFCFIEEVMGLLSFLVPHLFLIFETKTFAEVFLDMGSLIV